MELITKKAVSDQKGAQLLFVHGAWHGAWCWEENYMPYFSAQGYTCHAFDLRGHGKKKLPGKRLKYRMKDYVGDLEDAISSLPGKPVLIGHSMGGYIVQKYLEKNNVPAAILLATIPSHGAVFAAIRKAVRHPVAFAKMNVFFRLYPLVSTPALAKDAFFESDIPEAKLNGYFEKINDESYLGFLDMVFLDLPKPRKNAAEMLVLGVEKDSFFSPKEMKSTAKAFNAELKIFPGMSHDLMVDKNWKETADYILTWLKGKKP